MPRKATGQVIAPDGKQRSWALRFRAYGKRRYVTLGRPEDGWTRERAEVELRHVLADVERGIWRPARAGGRPAGAEGRVRRFMSLRAAGSPTTNRSCAQRRSRATGGS